MLCRSMAAPHSPMQSKIQPTVPSPPQARTRKSGVSRKKLSLEKAGRQAVTRGSSGQQDRIED